MSGMITMYVYNLFINKANKTNSKICFKFTFLKLLCGRELPNYVNRLAYVSTCIPFLQKCIPKEWLTPCALEETVNQAIASTNVGTSTVTGGSNPSSSRNSLSGSGGGGITFLEMIRGNNENSTSVAGSSSSPPPPTSSSVSAGGLISNLINSCNGTRKSSTSSENSPPCSPTPQSSRLSRTENSSSSTGLLQRFQQSS
jgi:hypothetical protein